MDCPCGSCPSGALPSGWVEVYVAYCDSYGTPHHVSVRATVQDAGDEARHLVKLDSDIGPFDTEADVRRFVDSSLMESMRALTLWRRAT